MEAAWNIQLQDLTLGYGDNIVLEKLNAALPGGKISVILGGSGCGKSTLLRHLIGLKRPMDGKIIMGGQDIFSLGERSFRRLRRRMGMLFQDGALLGSLTLGENVGLPLYEHTGLGPAQIKEAVLHKLSLVGLEKFYDYYPNALSGGMRKRAGLARALVTEPPILLCDEPTSGLDPLNSAQMDNLLLDMKARKPEMTIVVVSHDLQSLQRIADHVLVLHDRKAVFNGPLAALNDSGNAYLRRFLDRNPEMDKQGNPHEMTAQTSQAVQEALDEWLS